MAAAAAWLLEQDGDAGPTLAIHLTRGDGAAEAGIERAAGALRVALDLRAAPGWLCHLLLTETLRVPLGAAAGGFEGATAAESAAARSLYRMSSPSGAEGPQSAASVEPRLSSFSGARCFEAAPDFASSDTARFAASWVAGAATAAPAENPLVQTSVFLLPKEGEVFLDCQDVISSWHGGRLVMLSDGAGTASYSAEWARALCRRAGGHPPPCLDPGVLSGDPPAEQLKRWLAQAVADWEPEVPWERLTRPATYNKARAGSGATLAGVEFTGSDPAAGAGFRAWALGDSCVIQIRAGALLCSLPISDPGEFGYEPKLLMTRPGYEEKYAVAWRDWRGALEPGDWLLLATDALAEHLLRACTTNPLAGGDALPVILADLAGLSTPAAAGRFSAYVAAQRAAGTLRNDDVALAVCRLRGP